MMAVAHKPAQWLDALVEIDVDVTSEGRRAVRGRRADGVAIARIGKAATGFEHEIVAAEHTHRAPELDATSRIAGAVLPFVCSTVPGLSVTSDTELVRTYVNRFKNQQKFAVFPRAFSRRFNHGFGYQGDPGGWASWVATGRTFLFGFPDVKVELQDLFEVEGLVVEHNLATGTHLGRFRNVEATGRVVTWREVHIYRCVDRRIVRNWPTVDVQGILQSLKA
jgi:predicted ester cyclase